jgi:hypothetical protein
MTMAEEVKPKEKKSRAKASKKSKIVPKNVMIQFLDEIYAKFEKSPHIGPLKNFTAALQTLQKIPEGWSQAQVKKFLIDTGIIKNSLAKPAGYSYNEQIWGDVKVKVLRDEDPLKKEEPAPVIPATASEPVPPPPPQNPQPIPVIDPSPTPIVKEKPIPEPPSTPTKTEAKTLPEVENTHPGSGTLSVGDHIPTFSNYLLKRISSDARKAMQMGFLEIDRTDLNHLEKAFDHLNTARMFFDPGYPNEKEILDFLDQKTAYISKRMEILQEQLAERLIREIILEPLNKGKFDKYIANWGSKYGIEDCVYEIFDKIGGKIQKIPLSEAILRKRLINILKEKYPNKPGA